jgi:phosphate:Na+ symporter
MDATLSLLNLAGAIALLLWGVHMVQSGVQRAFGSDLRRFLTRALSGRIKAAAAGLGVTAVLQSSTATGLMVASFAANGFVALVPALAVMLGANVGTTLIVQALSFDVSRLSPLLLLAENDGSSARDRRLSCCGASGKHLESCRLTRCHSLRRKSANPCS